MSKAKMRKWMPAFLSALAVLSLASCAQEDPKNLISQEDGEKRTVNLFSPMEKSTLMRRTWRGPRRT